MVPTSVRLDPRRRARGSRRSARATRSAPSCCRSRTAATPRSTCRRPARPGRLVFKTGPGADAAGARPGSPTARRSDLERPTPSGRPVSPGTYLVAIETRDEAGNRGLSPPLNRRGLPVRATAPSCPGHGGITVRYLGVRPPNVATRAGRPGRVLRRRAAQAVDLVGAPGRTGAARRAAARRRRGCACTPPGASPGVYLLQVRTATHTTTVPFAVQSAKRHRVLVVLPVMTWQGRNSLDDDGDGLPNVLDRGVGAKLFRVYAGDGLPADFAERDAPLLAWLDRRAPPLRHHHRRGARRGTRPAPGGPPGRHPPLRRALAAARPAAAPAPLRARRRARRHLRHRLAAPPGLAHRRGRMIDPTPPATTDVFGVRLRPLRACPSPATS